MKEATERLRKLMRDALAQYNADLAAGGEPVFPAWTEDLRAVLEMRGGHPPTPPVVPEGMEDPVFVPRGLLGAACYAIRTQRERAKVLVELRRYTTGDRSGLVAAPAAPTGSAQAGKPDDADLYCIKRGGDGMTCANGCTCGKAAADGAGESSPLPRADYFGSTAVPEDTPLYTEDQMHEYARACKEKP